jgi:hypothetical protein
VLRGRGKKLPKRDKNPVTAEGDAAMFCSYCYKQVEVEKRLGLCARCHKRSYCSKECQTADWKGGHKHWCEIAGEIGFDFKIKGAGNKGLGLFAMRKFERGEKVMAERPVTLNDTEHSTIRSAVMNLAPANWESLLKKFAINAIGCGDGFTGQRVCITMSRVNHHCVGNTMHWFVPEHGVIILVASRTIQAGEEITFAYVDFLAHPQPTGALRYSWDIHCQCEFCTDGTQREKLIRMHGLDKEIVAYGRTFQFDQAFRAGEELLRLYDEVQDGPFMYARTYYDLFQVAVTRRATLDQAQEYANRAYQEARLFLGDIDTATLCKYRTYAADITKHPAYLIAEEIT